MPTSPELESGLLLPCPFCGGTALERGDPKARLARWVNCKECNADMVGKTLDEAITKWNRRASPSSLSAAREMGRALEAMVSIVEHCTVSAGVCMCGDDMAKHSDPMACGHSPVDMGQYHMDAAYKDAQAALKAARTAGLLEK